MLARLQAAVAAGMAERGVTASLADELLDERRADTSLEPDPPPADPAQDDPQR